MRTPRAPSASCRTLKSPEQRTAFADENRREQERAREKYRGPSVAHLLSLEEARRRKPVIDWNNYQPPVPSFTGTRKWECVPLAELVPFIDWTPFFHAWELKGAYPRILEDKTVGPRAKELLDDARQLLEANCRGKIADGPRGSRLFPGQ